MKFLAVLIIIISLSKLAISLLSKPSDESFQSIKTVTPEQAYVMLQIVLTIDGSIGLLCGLFILFMI